MASARSLFRKVAYRTGALRALRDPRTLTVVMFHRVVDAADPDFIGADPTYTIALDIFTDLLVFFRRHYQAISLAELSAARSNLDRLPDHALMITFDDGWADNFRYAAPVLQRYGLPSTLFVAAGAVAAPEKIWWQEQVFARCRQGGAGPAIARLVTSGKLSAHDTIDPLELVCRIALEDEAERHAILASIPMPAPAARMMLRGDDLLPLSATGMSIGIHGYSHMPLTKVADIETELERARSFVVSLTGDDASAQVMSLPHGRYDTYVIKSARRAGIRLIFSSDPTLTGIRGGALATTRPIGRIGIETSHLVDPAGRFDPARAATLLWRRSIA